MIVGLTLRESPQTATNVPLVVRDSAEASERTRSVQGSTRGRASTATRSLAAACVAGGTLCLLSSAFPYSPESATRLAFVVGCVGVVTGAALLRAGGHARPRVLHGVVATTSIVTATFVSLAASIQEQLLTTIGFIWIGVYVACFFSRQTALAHVGFMIGCYTAALSLSPIGPSMITAATMMATACALSLMTNLLVSRMRQLADLDPLTGLLRRSAFLAYVQEDLDRSAKDGVAPSLAVLDLDGFKEVNDSVGHAAGDALLADLSYAWTANVRAGDLLGRYGGDEFVLYMPATPIDEAYWALRRLDVARRHITWSAGVTQWQGEPLHEWLERTDRALYDDKRTRRGRAAS